MGTHCIDNPFYFHLSSSIAINRNDYCILLIIDVTETMCPLRMTQAEDPPGPHRSTRGDNTSDAQGDRETPAEPPESDDEMKIQELPGPK